jgi:hypothetical protein
MVGHATLRSFTCPTVRQIRVRCYDSSRRQSIDRHGWSLVP